jgi:hypothetical protein
MPMVLQRSIIYPNRLLIPLNETTPNPYTTLPSILVPPLLKIKAARMGITPNICTPETVSACKKITEAATTPTKGVMA